MARRSTMVVSSIVVAVFVILALSATSALAASSTVGSSYFGPDLSGTSTLSSANKSDTSGNLVQVALSDEQSRAIFTRTFGPLAAASAKRVNTRETLEVKFASMTTAQSPNWCGYENQTSGIMGASGSFNVQMNDWYNHVLGEQSTWVGVSYTDPNNSNNNQILQAGIDGKTGLAWYEVLPAPAYGLFQVSDNDHIDVKCGEDMQSGIWYMVIYDATRYAYADVAYSGYVHGPLCADWIVEAPTDLNHHIVDIGTFGTVNFTACQWWNSSGALSNIDSGYGYYCRYDKHDPTTGALQAVPSSISYHQNFSVRR